MFVTLVVDASYCHKTKSGGYGFWVVSNRGSFPGSGVIKTKPENNVIAEMFAVCNALYDSIHLEKIQSNDEILIQTDCLAAIQAFRFDRTKLSKQEIDAIQYLDNISVKLNLKIRFRHVKGHTNNSEPRYIANKLCDMRAKKEMKKMREA